MVGKSSGNQSGRRAISKGMLATCHVGSYSELFSLELGLNSLYIDPHYVSIGMNRICRYEWAYSGRDDLPEVSHISIISEENFLYFFNLLSLQTWYMNSLIQSMGQTILPELILSSYSTYLYPCISSLCRPTIYKYSHR